MESTFAVGVVGWGFDRTSGRSLWLFCDGGLDKVGVNGCGDEVDEWKRGRGGCDVCDVGIGRETDLLLCLRLVIGI